MPLVDMDILIIVLLQKSFSLVLILNPDLYMNKKIAARGKWRKDRNKDKSKKKVYRKLRDK